jgi:hypothetical protein
MRYFSRTVFLLSNLSVELDFLQVLLVVEGQVPAMPPDLFVKYQKSKRQIRAKQIDNCIANNIVTSSVRNNSKCIVLGFY